MRRLTQFSNTSEISGNLGRLAIIQVTTPYRCLSWRGDHTSESLSDTERFVSQQSNVALLAFAQNLATLPTACGSRQTSHSWLQKCPHLLLSPTLYLCPQEFAILHTVSLQNVLSVRLLTILHLGSNAKLPMSFTSNWRDRLQSFAYTAIRNISPSVAYRGLPCSSGESRIPASWTLFKP